MAQYKRKLEIWRLRRDKMRELKAQGVSLSEIARKYRISRQRVYQLVGDSSQWLSGN